MPRRDNKGRFLKGNIGWNKGMKGFRHSGSFKIKNLHWRWKGGKITNKDGYILILKKEHPNTDYRGYVKEHRLVMETHLGRYLTKDKTIHHLDGNKINNKIENLYLFKNNSEHIKYHQFLRKCINQLLEVEI